MPLSRLTLRRLVLPLGAGINLLLTGAAWAQEVTPDVSPESRAEIVHVLNRITFGPRPGDVEAVAKIGLQNYIEQQLHPETLNDSAVEQEVAHFELLQMSPQELSQMFDQERQKAKQRQLQKLQEQKQKEAMQAGQPVADNQGDIQPPPPPPVPPKDKLAAMTDMANQYRSVAAIGQLEQAKLVRAVDSQRQLQEVLVDFWSNHFNIDVKKGPDQVLKVADDRDVIRPHIWGRFRDLLEASAKSPAMLFYLDNATNTVGREVTPQQQMRQAMVMEKMGLTPPIDPNTPMDQLQTKKQGGINENYAREIMELHTLGVDGGYTQQDVQEVARCFTGWSFDRQTGAFLFRDRQHDNGSKVVLGHTIPAGGGINDGEIVLDILCSEPACAHHIALQMCQRFVSDDPSPALVDRIAGVFTKSDGDLRKVTKAILTSPEFLDPANFGNKIKSPLEFAVSAVRATDSTLIAQQPPPFDRIVPAMEGAGVLGRGQAADRIAKNKRQSLNWHIYELGEPLFACTPPTGYKEVSKFWVSPGALIERLNFAMALTQQEVNDVRFDSQKIISGTDLDKGDAVLNQCIATLLQNNITDTTRQVLEKSALPAPDSGQTVDAPKLIALIIGSPEFQRK